jgi:hypothetical protein
MSDLRILLANLRRPRLLMHAARFGLGEYRRERDLRRLVKGTPTAEETLPRLIEAERHLEDTRLSGDASYSIARHIDVLIALLAEAQLLRRAETV